jgi:hypothetical protein
VNCLKDRVCPTVFRQLKIAACVVACLVAGLGTGQAKGQKNGVPEEGGLPSVVLSQAPFVLMHSVDSNSPVHWDGGKLYLINSAGGHQYVSSGPDVAHLGYRTLVHLGDTDDRLYIWIEATWMSPDGTLYGAYHYEPDALCNTNSHLPTAP